MHSIIKVKLRYSDRYYMEMKDGYFLLTQLYNKFLALQLDKVLGIFKLEALTPIPNNKNKHLLGITNVKGHIVPVLNLKFDEEVKNNDLLVVYETAKGKFGALFKDVKDVIFLTKEELEEVKFEKSPFFHGRLTKNSKDIVLVDLETKIDIKDFENTFKPQEPKAA